MDFIAFFIAAVFVERTIEYFVKGSKIGNFSKWVALVLSVLVSVVYRLDLLGNFGLIASIPFVGFVVTGVVISGGSNYLNDFIGLIRSKKTEGASDAKVPSDAL